MAFPPPHVVEPKTSHTHTVILLHGRGSEGPEFAEELFSSKSSNNESLKAHFPSCRWVFPSSRSRWSSVFQEELPAWFDVYSLTDPYARQDLQVDGLRESTLYIADILQREIDLLAGHSERVIIGGISQGMALALWVYFVSAEMSTTGRIGGLIGISGWFPFADKLGELQQQTISCDVSERGLTLANFLRGTIGCQDVQISSTVDIEKWLSTPTLLLHGTDDAFVDVGLGRQACQIMLTTGMEVDWNEYSGAENEGHWIKEPEGFDILIAFLAKQIFRSGK